MHQFIRERIDNTYKKGWSNFTLQNSSILDISTLYLRADRNKRAFLESFVLSNLNNLDKVLLNIPNFHTNKIDFLGSTYEIKKVSNLATIKEIDVSWIFWDVQPKGYILLKDGAVIFYSYVEDKKDFKQAKKVLLESAKTILQTDAINYIINNLTK